MMNPNQYIPFPQNSFIQNISSLMKNGVEMDIDQKEYIQNVQMNINSMNLNGIMMGGMDMMLY